MSGATEDAIEALSGGEDKVTCRECGESFGQITQSHLSMHGMEMAEYRERHPDAPVQSESVRRSRRGHSEETRERISEAIRKKHENGGYD